MPMNLRIILLISYIYFGEFKHLVGTVGQSLSPVVSSIPLANESSEKNQKVQHVWEQLSEEMTHRFDLEEAARLKADESADKYGKETESPFRYDDPPEDKGSLKYWNIAKEAADKADNLPRKHEKEPFCDPEQTDTICERAFKHSFFKDEKLTYFNYVSSASQENRCVKVSYDYQKDVDTSEKLPMELKMCWAMKTYEDRPKSLTRVYLRSAYKQPVIFGRTKYFVLFAYMLNPESTTGEWKIASDPNIEPANLKYRPEAYLPLSFH